jgi:hypothetical protein
MARRAVLKSPVRLVVALALIVGSPRLERALAGPSGPRFLVVHADSGPDGRLDETCAVFTADLMGAVGRSDLEPLLVEAVALPVLAARRR